MNEIERLRNRVDELEYALGLKELFRPETGLTLWQQQMAGLLLKRDFVCREQAFIAIYGARPEADQPHIKILDIVVHQLRRKLRPFGVEIKTAWGRGYYVDAENKARLRELADNVRSVRSAA